MKAWPFRDPPNVAVIASRKIVDGSDWAALVFHDEDDGGWQFHAGEPGPPHESDVRSSAWARLLAWMKASLRWLTCRSAGMHGESPKTHRGSRPLRFGRIDARSQQAGPPAT